MTPFDYRNLHDDALQVLESDLEIRAVYLDFLTFLHDIVNTRAPFGEPSMFDESTQAGRVSELAEELPEDAGIQAAAMENQEKALALLDGGSLEAAQEFMHALLREYNVVRLLRSRGGARRAIAF